MATLLNSRSLGDAERPLTKHRLKRLLVATDASPSAEAAVRTAREIARHSDASVSLVAVHESLPIVTPEVQLPPSRQMEAEGRSALRAQVLAQLEQIGVDENWPLEVVTGNAAASIARIADDVDASLIVVGLGEHGFFERIFGDETVLKLLRISHVPVLAVAPGTTSLPLEILAATDFSASSVRAAQLAAEILDGRGRLTLATVVEAGSNTATHKAPNAPFEGTIGAAFDLAISQLEPSQRTTVDRRILTGVPARAILDTAQQSGADLIVAGSHGHGFLTRLLIGSVSQQLVRGARCSVLVAPPEGGNYLDEIPELTTRFASYEWAERLEEFTRRNASRTATLEVIDPEIGAQIEEKGYPFVGASYDPRTAQVQIMLGDASAGGRHLTRAIGEVTAVQVLRDRAGRDLLLRVAHGRGQTLLTLER